MGPIPKLSMDIQRYHWNSSVPIFNNFACISRFQSSQLIAMSQEYIPPREIPRRKVINAGVAQQKFRRAVLEAAAELSAEFTNHYWKEIINGSPSDISTPKLPPPSSNHSLKKGFVFYLNASGRYLVLREHLRQAVGLIVQQKSLNMRPSGFQNHREFQNFLHDMYNFLMDEVYSTLNRTMLQETDPLETVPVPKSICGPNANPESLKQLQTKVILRQLLFYSEESLAQGDFDNCHKLHLQRICRSREDPDCWIDFGIMWLSKGDDRMAEIALREALQKDPQSFYALLIGGLIAIRHKDTRGLAVLGAALEMKPLCPELLVILGFSHASLGMEAEAEYFFKKAAFVHRTITGQSTEGLEQMLNKMPNVNSIGFVEDSMRDFEKTEAQYFKESAADAEEADNNKRTSKKSKKGLKEESLVGVENPRSSKVGRQSMDKRDSVDSGKRKSVEESRKKSRQSQEIEQLVEEMIEEDDFYTRKSSLSREPKNMLEFQPKFDVMPHLCEIRVEDSLLPILRPSLLIPWDITEFSEKLKSIVDIDAHFPMPASRKNPEDPSPQDFQDIATDQVIKAEYDKILKEESSQIIKEQSSTLANNRKSKRGSNSKNTKKSVASNKTKKSTKLEAVALDRKSKKLSHNPALVNIKQKNEEEKEHEDEIEEEALENEEMEMEDASKEDSHIIYVNRLGSELIWTGQLLLQLRMFDMLDGVLTRELYTSGKRTIQFLYLRAMSLYLRGSRNEAVPYIDEALQLDSENSVLWILRGHCYFEMDNWDEALKSYENSLRIPVGKENRHLLYLRYGSLSQEGGNYEAAKRVFLYGIQKYPTPNLWISVGNACYSMENYEEAEAAFAEANRLDNTNPLTWAYLSLINLVCENQSLAEQSYKWALRFGLKKGKVLDEIKKLQQEKGFGDPSFPRLPNCIPHDYYVRRLGRQKPFDIYRDALVHEKPAMKRGCFDNTERENALRDKLQQGNKPEESGDAAESISTNLISYSDFPDELPLEGSMTDTQKQPGQNDNDKPTEEQQQNNEQSLTKIEEQVNNTEEAEEDEESQINGQPKKTGKKSLVPKQGPNKGKTNNNNNNL